MNPVRGTDDMKNDVTTNHLLIMLFMALCCVAARGDAYQADLSWGGWKRGIHTYMTQRDPLENYSMLTLHDGVDEFNESLRQGHSLKFVHQRSIRLIAEVIRQVELVAIPDSDPGQEH